MDGGKGAIRTQGCNEDLGMRVESMCDVEVVGDEAA
jgi:hypothetical protein